MSEVTEEVVVTEEEIDEALYRHALCRYCYPMSDFGHETATSLCGTVYAVGLLAAGVQLPGVVPPDACPKCIETIRNPPVSCPLCKRVVIP